MELLKECAFQSKQQAAGWSFLALTGSFSVYGELYKLWQMPCCCVRIKFGAIYPAESDNGAGFNKL